MSTSPHDHEAAQIMDERAKAVLAEPPEQFALARADQLERAFRLTVCAAILSGEYTMEQIERAMTKR